MELLRIVSMLFVMILHANFLGIHAPTSDDIYDDFYSTMFRCLIESLSIVAVDVFVLISGWFGIRFSYRKLLALCFQVLFFSFGFYVIFAFFRPSDAFTIDRIKGIFLLNGDYWFVKSYIILFLLSPVLNLFVESVSQKFFLKVLLSYYAFHTVYGWLMDASVSFTMNGTTGLSFIGLYLLGRYLRLYPCILTTMNRNKVLLAYLGCAILLSICNLVLLYHGHTITVEGRLYSYASPFVIIASVALLLFFSKLSFSNKFVNWIASSCFAVYLFHCNGFFFNHYYRGVIDYFYYECDKAVWSIMAYILLLFSVSIIIDKIRLYIWNCFFENKR